MQLEMSGRCWRSFTRSNMSPARRPFAREGSFRGATGNFNPASQSPFCLRSERLGADGLGTEPSNSVMDNTNGAAQIPEGSVRARVRRSYVAIDGTRRRACKIEDFSDTGKQRNLRRPARHTERNDPTTDLGSRNRRGDRGRHDDRQPGHARRQLCYWYSETRSGKDGKKMPTPSYGADDIDEDDGVTSGG